MVLRPRTTPTDQARSREGNGEQKRGGHQSRREAARARARARSAGARPASMPSPYPRGLQNSQKFPECECRGGTRGGVRAGRQGGHSLFRPSRHASQMAPRKQMAPPFSTRIAHWTRFPHNTAVKSKNHFFRRSRSDFAAGNSDGPATQKPGF